MPNEPNLQEAIQNIEGSLGGIFERGVSKTKALEESSKKLSMQYEKAEKWLNKTTTAKIKYIKELKEEEKVKSKLTDQEKEMIDTIDESTEKMMNFQKTIALSFKIFDAISIDMDSTFKNMGNIVDKGLDDFIGQVAKINPALALAMKAVKTSISLWIEYQKETTNFNKAIMGSARSVRDYGLTAKDTRKQSDELRKTQVSYMQMLGMSAKEVEERMQKMVELGFKPTENKIFDLVSAHTMLNKEGLGLSESAIGKFVKILRVDFNKGAVDAAILLKSMAEKLEDLNISGEEAIEIQLNLLKKGRDYGLGLREVQDEVEKTGKQQLTYAQALRQVTELTTVPREMGMEKQLFLAQQLGESGKNIFETISKMRFGMGEMDKSGDKVMEVIARMAGIEKKRGELEMWETQKGSHVRQEFNISREVVETWGLSDKKRKELNKRMDVSTDIQKKQTKGFIDLLKSTSKLRSKFDEAADKFKASGRAILNMFGGVVGAPETEAFKEELKTPGAQRKERRAKEEEEPKEEKPKLGGGPIGYYQGGGQVPIMAHGGEYVFRQPSADALGRGNLDYMNQTGRLPEGESGGVNVNISGAMFEGLEVYIKGAVQRFFDEKAMTMG